MNTKSAALGGYIEKRASQILAANLLYGQLVAQEFTKIAHGVKELDEKTASVVNESVTVPLVLAVMAKEAGVKELAGKAGKGLKAGAKAVADKAKGGAKAVAEHVKGHKGAYVAGAAGAAAGGAAGFMAGKKKDK